jgi:hypothetical protein
MLRKPVICLLLCLLLGACSTKSAYNYLDWIMEWYVSGLVTLDEDQEWLFREALARELAWHRQQQLPLYIKSLDQLTDAINNGLTIGSLQQIYTEQENALRELSYRISPALTRLFTTLSETQIDQILENLEEQNQELEEDYVKKSPDELVKQRSERMIERIENWTGTLTSPQIQLIDLWSRQVKPASAQWIANRRAWQAKLGTVLRYNRQSPEYAKLIEELFVHRDKEWPESYRIDFENNLNLTMTMLVNLEKQLSAGQRRHLLEEIAVLRKQLTELHHQ